MTRQLTAIIEREGDGYMSLCPELDIASQGATVDQARDNLEEALHLFFESASATEVQHRLHGHDEVRIGTLSSIIRQSGLPRQLFE